MPIQVIAPFSTATRKRDALPSGDDQILQLNRAIFASISVFDLSTKYFVCHVPAAVWTHNISTELLDLMV